MTISYSSHKLKQSNKHEEKLISEILLLESSLSEINKERLLSLQEELNVLRSNKLKGAFVRSRSIWIENGDKNTQYFCNLEKQNAINKSMPFIEKDNGIFIYNQTDILNESKNYYENLYDEKHKNTTFNLDEEFTNIEVNKLTDEHNLYLEGTLTYEEITNTLKHMKNDKSPGCDGLSSNFYKVFWSKIGHFVVRALNYAFESNSFSKNIKLGTITCIPKDNKPKQFLKKLETNYFIKCFIQVSLWYNSQ